MNARVRLQARLEHRKVAGTRGGRDLGGAGRGTHHQQRIGTLELSAQRRPQRAGRDHLAVADAAPGVDHQHREILGQRRILKPVIHDDDAGAGGDCEARAGNARSRHHGRRRARQQQRLVADLGRTMPGGIDRERTGKLAAIAAAEERGPLAGRHEHAGDRKRGRRLAGAADGQIADADHRHAGARPRCLSRAPATAP